jgi:hypothetical protein
MNVLVDLLSRGLADEAWHATLAGDTNITGNVIRWRIAPIWLACDKRVIADMGYDLYGWPDGGEMIYRLIVWRQDFPGADLSPISDVMVLLTDYVHYDT